VTIVEIEENRVTRDPPAATANRRIVSPPTKRRKAAVEAEQPAVAQQTNKKHHYSTDELQAYIDRQRRERKRHMQTEASSDLPKHKERHYNEENVRSYIEKKKKEQKTALSAVKRHSATLAAAKAERVERVIDEQKKRSTVSAATILLDGLLLNAASTAKPVDIEGIRYVSCNACVRMFLNFLGNGMREECRILVEPQKKCSRIGRKIIAV
jgi:hypothetical protein